MKHLFFTNTKTPQHIRQSTHYQIVINLQYFYLILKKGIQKTSEIAKFLPLKNVFPHRMWKTQSPKINLTT